MSRYTGQPMDLANMRENGVRALLVNCLDCSHRAEINVDDQPGHLAVKSFERSFAAAKKRSPGRRRGCARAWPVECFLGKWCRPSLSYIFKHSRKAPARLYFPGGRPFRIDAASFASIFHEKQLARLGDPTHVRGGALTDGAAGMQSPSTTLRDLLSWLVLSGQRTALRKARHNQSQPLRW
jgi:hypothetical protein